MENFNEHFKGIFDGHWQVPTKGLIATQRFAKAPSLCTNWLYGIASRTALICVSGSRLFSKRPEHL
jgi:hypothetical protein